MFTDLGLPLVDGEKELLAVWHLGRRETAKEKPVQSRTGSAVRCWDSEGHRRPSIGDRSWANSGMYLVLMVSLNFP